VTEPAACVVTDGLSPVVSVRSDPAVVPAAFVATSRKWYVVPAVRPLRLVDTATPLDPDPALASTAGECDPYDVVVP
jgi:hypothetical protein